MRIYKNTVVRFSRIERWFLIFFLACFALNFGGMAAHCLHIGEIGTALLLMMIFALFVLALLVLPRFLPYLGIDEDRIVVFFSRRRRREIPCGDIAWISASRWCRMPSIRICLRDSGEEFEIPYQKIVMDELVRLSGIWGWKVL